MEINRLSQAEFALELTLRGLTAQGTVDNLRKYLRSALNLEKSGCTFPAIKVPLTAQENHDFQQKLNELRQLACAETLNPSLISKIKTKLCHLEYRLSKYLATGDLGLSYFSHLQSELKQIESEWNKRNVADFSHSLIEIPDQSSHSALALETSILDMLNEETHQNIPSFSRAHPSNSPRLEDPSVHEMVTCVRPIPVYQWNLTFSGENSVSVNAFLERVREYSITRHISEHELFISAVELFSGKALVWYRANREHFHSWFELSQALRYEFQPMDYDYRLLDEIRQRTQGSDESISIYISVMENLFRRLTVPVSEDYKLSTIRRNILPFYQSQLGLVSLNSLQELVRYGKQLELSKFRSEYYRPPPTSQQFLEPDLAYRQRSSVSSSAVHPLTHSSVSATQLSVCWNCRQEGHRFMNCSQPKNRFCHRCGYPNVVISTCPSCSKKNHTSQQSKSNSENLQRSS